MPRTAFGSYIVEAVIIPFVLLFCIFLPIVDLATTSMRFGFLWVCTRDACFHAAKAKTFLSDVSAKNKSAKSIAQEVALMEASRFSGIGIDSVETAILITDVDKKTMTRQTAVLGVAPDTDKFIYQMEVVVNGRIRPLLLFSKKFFGSIPGLTEWLPVSIRSKEYFESPQGLML